MSPQERCVIIGASHAATQLIASLRQEGWTGAITVVGSETHLPYHRPPLSKTVLTGESPFEKILLRPEAFYQKQEVDLKLGTTVNKIDRNSKSVALSDGSTLAYSKLIITTGADPIVLNLPGESLDGIGYLRSYDDIVKLMPHVAEGKKAVIVGGGYIGLETAAALRKCGMEATILEGMDRVLQRVTGPKISAFYTQAHAKRGVEIVTGAQVSGFDGDGHVSAVLCKDGSRYDADLVVIGVGVRPNIHLAQEAGLAIENGICVDEFSQTEDSDIFAVGDCASFPSAHTGARLRLESVPNATEQAKAAAAKICGQEKPYAALPWFWSDQYDIKLQIAGLSIGFDDIVIRGDMETEKFSAWYYAGDKLLAVDCINAPKDFMLAKKLLNAKQSPSKAAASNPEAALLS